VTALSCNSYNTHKNKAALVFSFLSASASPPLGRASRGGRGPGRCRHHGKAAVVHALAPRARALAPRARSVWGRQRACDPHDTTHGPRAAAPRPDRRTCGGAGADRRPAGAAAPTRPRHESWTRAPLSRGASTRAARGRARPSAPAPGWDRRSGSSARSVVSGWTRVPVDRRRHAEGTPCWTDAAACVRRLT